ncbi:MAG TPA: CoA transferase [Dehalococcoidia bacterium]|nr:CoA transferase [Dehalococcoidia bacterium]
MSRKPRPPSLPLEGVRVVDMTWVWAGPVACMLLAMLGAEVIKVESRDRLDFFRRYAIWPLADAEPTELSTDGSMMFLSANMSKLGVTLNLGRPEGKDILRRLIAVSDVVVENMRPGAMERMGLGYDALRKINPAIIMLSSSARGASGPESQYAGYAAVNHAIGGAAHITGYPDGPPGYALGDVDLMNATTSAFAIVAALRYRDLTGEGQFIDYSQSEGVTSLIGEVLLDYQMTGRMPGRKGNSDEFMAPHNVYPCWGIDRWLAIAVETDDEFAALCDVMEMPELRRDPRFASAEARKRNEAALDEIIGGWTHRRDRDFAAKRLGEAGVAAAPCRDGQDLFRDPHLRARGVFSEVERPEGAGYEVVGLPWKSSAYEPAVRRAPLLGEHNDYVFRDVLGLVPAEIERLRREGVID